MTLIPAVYGALIVILSCIGPTLALHASEAGVVDWYKALVGTPLVNSLSTAPLFHRVGRNNASTSTQSVILTATSSNVLAALDPVTGNVAWRHVFDVGDPITTFRAHDDVVVALSGPGGATLRTFNALTGSLIVEKRLHKPDAGRLFEPADLGSHLVFSNADGSTGLGSSEVFALTNGHMLRRVNSLTGELTWGWTASDVASLVVYSRVVSTPSAVYLVGLTKSGASYSLHIDVHSPATGDSISTTTVPSSIYNGLTDFMVLSDSSLASIIPRIVWLEKGTLMSVALTPDLKEKPTSVKGMAYMSIKDVGLNENGQFVALRTDGTARVMKLDKDGRGIKGIWEFADSAKSDRYTESLFAGGIDKDGRPYITRVYWSHVLRQATAHVFSAHLAEGKGMVTGYTVPFNTNAHGIIDHVALDVANPTDYTVVARLVLTTNTGAVQLWQQDQLQWTREESLADIQIAEFVELPEKKLAASHAEGDGETFGARLIRQISDARGFPSYIINFVKRFVTGSYASVTTSAVTDTNSSEPLFRDAFGFRKVLVVATSRGIVFGINSGNGAILWSRILGLGWAHEVGGRHQPVKLFVTRTVSDGESPQVVLLTQRLADNSLVDTVAFHLDALTGEDARRSSPQDAVLEGVDVVASEILDAFLLRGDEKIVVMVDTHLQVYLYPDTEQNKRWFSTIASRLHFPLQANDRLLGHKILPTIELTGRFLAYPTWTTQFPPGEVISALVPRPSEPVASLGKVLGDRTTLYKYLNPNLIAVGTVSRLATAPSCGVYLLDGAKGTILYHVNVPPTNGVCNIIATLTENWLVYVYYDDDVVAVNQAKGHRIVSVELYEGSQVNDKTGSSDASIYANETSMLSVYEQSYVFPSGVTALTTTSTKFGITVKDLIVANHRNQIQSFTRRMLDPRRPKRKPTALEQEEWLVQYDPVIPDDSRRIISHNYQVMNIRRILTSPALLESTSLVFAYGLDLFSTRVTPSNTFDVLNENFNKAQLVLTVAALAIAIIVTKPMVARKRLRERWYQS